MLDDEIGHSLDPFDRLQEGLEVDRPVEDPIEVFDVGNPFRLGEVQELPLELLPRYQDLVRRERVVKLERRSVFDGLAD